MKDSSPKRAVIFWTAGFVFFLLLLLLLWSLLWRNPWITPLPNVVLTPSRPVLKLSNIRPNSAVDYLIRASAEMDRVLKLPEIVKNDAGLHFRDDEAKRMNTELWSDTAFPATLKVLNESGPTLDLVHKAIAAGDPQMPTHQTILDSLSYVSRVTDIAKMMRASATVKAAGGDFEGAYAELNDEMDFGDILSRGGNIIHRLLQITCEVNALRAMRFIALQNEIPPAVALKTIRHLDAVDRAMESFAEAFRYESLTIPDIIKIVFDPKSAPAGTSSMYMGDFEKLGAIGPLVGSTKPRMREDMESVYAHLIELSEKPYDRKELEKMDTLYDHRKDGVWFWLTVRDPLGYILGGITTPVFGSVIIKHHTLLVELRATEMVLAIRQYEQDEKHPPANAGELVPKYLPAIPLDPYDGKPLRYITKPGGWAVYSVGQNQVDEKGLATPTPSNYKSPGDVVYPNTEIDDAKAKLSKSSAAHVTRVPMGTPATPAP